MNRLRNRLILVFLVATLAPLAATLWITTSLLERSLGYASTRELAEISQSLEKTGRELYQRARDALKADAAAGHLVPQRFSIADRRQWPEPVAEFFESAQTDRFLLAGHDGDRLQYLVRRNLEVWVYERPLGGVGMNRLTAEIARARALVEAAGARDLRRGFRSAFVVLAAAVWIVALVLLVYLAHRVSRPIQQLTAGLSDLGAGNLAARVPVSGNDEIGAAASAFNQMAEQLQQSRDRLLYLTRLESWQALARKMAHELKNSLTPIRLTVEEMVARHSGADRAFLEQAAQIVTDEVGSLERRVRAFSELAAEPPVSLSAVDVNSLVEERVAFLKSAHPEVIYTMRLATERPRARADVDLIKGVLTNLLENAAEAAGPGGVVLARTGVSAGRVEIEVHDSGPGISLHARGTLFEPTISFKKSGMGLGLSIARKSALLSGGDILLVKGELGGAAFRVALPECPSASSSSTTKKTSVAPFA